jgi:Na+-transporting NADH:ubiquinone oxidoreductase subunit C
MKTLSPTHGILSAIAIVFFSALIVSVAVSFLKPIRVANRAPAEFNQILKVAGLLSEQQSSQKAFQALQLVEARLINLESGQVEVNLDVHNYDYRVALADQTMIYEIPKSLDIAQLGRRPKYMPVYWIHSLNTDAKLVLPIYSKGMWSVIHGYVALQEDFNTIVSIRFYEHGETPGIGDRIEDPVWIENWKHKRIYQNQLFNLHINKSMQGSSLIKKSYQVDGISGATMTVNGIANGIEYWFGDNGYGRYLRRLNSSNEETKQ